MAKLRTHANIPVFIPHLGCPNDCVFCDQRTISGTTEFSEDRVRDLIESSLNTLGDRRAEIAFFGGSFTGIDRGLMIRLLDLAEEYVKRGRVVGIRMSTRPDYISDEIIDVIGRYTLSEVELGIQSMSDRVLALSRRGHTAADSVRAVTKLVKSGIAVGGQMMIGLPGATLEDEENTAREICRLGAASCRIYPTIVFRGTCLSVMTERGEYTPLSVDEAVSRSASALKIFEENGVNCLRVGLQDSENLHSEEKYLAGPVHPAMGELVRGELFRREIEKALEVPVSALDSNDLDGITVEVPRGKISMAVGVSGVNRDYFREKYDLKKIIYKENEALDGFGVNITPLSRDSKTDRKGGENVCI